MPKSLRDVYKSHKAWDYADLAVRSFYGYSKNSCHGVYPEQFKKASTLALFDFDGDLPAGCLPNQFVCQTLTKQHYTIIELIACGFCEKLNPNLISSFGYDIST